MAKYDVYPNPSGDSYLLDVQSDLLAALNTRMVVPLISRDRAPEPAMRLNPVFDIDGEACVMVTQFMAAVPLTLLKRPVAHLEPQFETITTAIDMLTQEF